MKGLETASNQQENMYLPRSHSASAFHLSIVSLQGQLMFLLSHFLLFYLHGCFSKIAPRDRVQRQICHVSAEPCRSATLGISVVTLNLRLHDTRSQNTGAAGTSLPSMEKQPLSQAGHANSPVCIQLINYIKMTKGLPRIWPVRYYSFASEAEYYPFHAVSWFISCQPMCLRFPLQV